LYASSRDRYGDQPESVSMRSTSTWATNCP
jgi:hypothetical protein